MRGWKRVVVETKCGLCGRRLERGTPMFVYAGIGWQKWRCRTCMKEQPPPDLPALEVVDPVRTMQRISELRGELPFDFKTAQSGEND